MESIRVYTEFDIVKFASNFNLGKGTKDDPIVFTLEHKFSRSLELKSCNLHIIFNSYDFNRLEINRCKSITLNKSIINNLVLVKCYESIFSHCKVNYLSLTSSFKNIFESCNINVVSNSFSKGNSFQNLYSDNLNIDKSIYGKNINHYIVALLIIPIVVFNLINVFQLIDPSSDLLFVWLFAIFVVIFITVALGTLILRNLFEMRKYGPNIIT